MAEGNSSLRKLKACLANRLSPLGFTAEGDGMWRRVHDTLILLEVQKDLKRSTKEAILFTINVGISVNALRAESGGTAPASSEARIERSHWRERLGRLLPTGSDVWWTVRDEQTAQLLCDEISAALTEHVLPQVEQIASSDALVRLWREDKGRGLTEYERRSNLAALLCKTGQTDEADAAIQALEEASIGKSWEVSARVTAEHLRKQLTARRPPPATS